MNSKCVSKLWPMVIFFVFCLIWSVWISPTTSPVALHHFLHSPRSSSGASWVHAKQARSLSCCSCSVVPPLTACWITRIEVERKTLVSGLLASMPGSVSPGKARQELNFLSLQQADVGQSALYDNLILIPIGTICLFKGRHILKVFPELGPQCPATSNVQSLLLSAFQNWSSQSCNCFI